MVIDGEYENIKEGVGGKWLYRWIERITCNEHS